MISDNQRLAIFGGQQTIDHQFTRYNSIGDEEVEAAHNVVKSGVLSKFLGGWDPDWLGGPKVKEFEQACRSHFDVKHAITVNSWTSGLIAAVGAIGVEPGDEIIVPPWTMCATATSILHWNAIPVFADIESDTFCLDPKSVEENITPRTKAIIAVDIFGHSVDIESINKLASSYGLKVISDTAQAPGALVNSKYAGTMADIGGYSLNYHKHIHTGEGGILITNSDELAKRLMLIRNHAEAVVGGMHNQTLTNMLGYNFRLGEIECAIGIEQLKKLKRLVASRQIAANRLTGGLRQLPGLRTPIVKQGYTHAFYIYPLVLDVDYMNVRREQLIAALQAEGVPGLTNGYANVHMLPMYQKKLAYGSGGFPWTSEFCDRDVIYTKGICPVAEKLHDQTFIGLEMCLHELPDYDVDQVISAFYKVWANLKQVREIEVRQS